MALLYKRKRYLNFQFIFTDMAKHAKDTLTIAAIFLLVLTISFFLYLFNFMDTAFDEDFYKKEFKEYNVYETLSGNDIEKINKDVLNYLRFEDEEKLVDNGFFTEREKMHLLDVKDIIQVTVRLYYFLLALLLFLLFLLIILLMNPLRIIKYLGIIFLVSGGLSILFTLVIFFLVNTDFSTSFSTFHNLFFEPGTFLFDGNIENIVNLYPEMLFFDITKEIVTNTMRLSFLMLIMGSLFLVIKRYVEKQKNI